MDLRFYYGSGSTFAWRVWLALEHKRLTYTLHVLSFSDGDLRTPDFLELNPRGQVPTVVHDGFSIPESLVIMDYLEETFPSPPLLPNTPRDRANVRRAVKDVDQHLQPATRQLMRNTLVKNAEQNPDIVATAARTCVDELVRLEERLTDLKPVDVTGYADFAIYPTLAMLRRVAQKSPQHSHVFEGAGPGARTLMRRVESLSFFDQTIPPHWRG